jgi:hypothetical protein
MAYRPLETLLYPLHASRILGRSQDKKWILDLAKFSFCMGQRVEN